MRIAINTLPIQPYMTGIGHFARELLMASSHVTGHSFSRIAQSGENPAIESWNGEVWGVDSPSSVWEQLHLPGLLNERRSDLYVSPLFTCPLIRDVPSVVTIHDCIPKARPDLCTPAFLDYHEQFCAPCARAAEVILTVSHHSKQEICSYYDVPEERPTRGQVGMALS